MENDKKLIAEERIKDILKEKKEKLSCWDIATQLNQTFQWTSVVLNRLVTKNIIGLEYIKPDNIRGYHVYFLKQQTNTSMLPNQ